MTLAAPLAGLATSGASVPADAPVRLDGVVESFMHGVDLTGTARAPWRAPCGRCLAEVEGVVSTEVREIFDDRAAAERGEDVQALVGDEIDCEPAVREAVLLALPLVPLCRDDCQGLCPQCGVDRNTSTCGCTLEQPDPRWAALDALHFDDVPGSVGDDN